MTFPLPLAEKELMPDLLLDYWDGSWISVRWLSNRLDLTKEKQKLLQDLNHIAAILKAHHKYNVRTDTVEGDLNKGAVKALRETLAKASRHGINIEKSVDHFYDKKAEVIDVRHCVRMLKDWDFGLTEPELLDIQHLFQVTKKNLYQLSDCKDLKKISKSLNKIDLKKGKLEAEKRLKSRFSGAEALNMDYPDLQKSSFHKKFNKRVIKKTKRKKILICAHEFFDAPHIYGKNFFSDFYEWMEYIGKISNETSYDWYIKNHVNQPGKYKIYQPATVKILKDFVKKYKNIKILPNNYSHQQILQEKVDFVLTVYGSIGYEYPYFNIPVINATKNHPGRKYDFSITPKSKKEYGSILKNLDNLKFKINKDEILEYYYLRFIYNGSYNWLVNYTEVLKEFKEWSNIYNDKFYNFYMKKFDKIKYTKNSKKYLDFINSNNYRIRDMDLN